jgi:chromate transport protein ChrA
MERELVGEKKWVTKEEMREGIATFFLKAGSLTFGSGLVIVPSSRRASCSRRVG